MYKHFIAPPQHMHDQQDANLVYFSPFLLYQRQNSRRIKHMCKCYQLFMSNKQVCKISVINQIIYASNIKAQHRIVSDYDF